MTITSYSWLTRLLSPALWLWDYWRAYKQPIYKPHRSERWARGMPAPISKQLIWIHAVSVGETQACAPLLRALLREHPQHSVLLTHMTPTGRSTGASLFADEISLKHVQQCYLPYDVAGLPERFLEHFKPECGVIMETEVWPNLVAACTVVGVPLGLANARLSEKTLIKSLRFTYLAQNIFNMFTWVAAQSSLDAYRLSKLRKGPIVVTGNLKFDVTANELQLSVGHAFKAEQSSRLTIALASTREGEETVLLQSIKSWLTQQSPHPLVLLIPRHPKRADELLLILKKHGFNVAQRSQQQAPTACTQVYLCDTFGEMWFYYGASDIAIVGGGWLPLGGQNLIEPCMSGCATIVGPHMFNFANATELALLEGAIVQCNAAQLPEQLEALSTQSKRNALVKNGLKFASKHVGATARHLTLINLNYAAKK
jgi:3-deoxy-D-manno-octulosonic-acid transferase